MTAERETRLTCLLRDKPILSISRPDRPHMRMRGNLAHCPTGRAESALSCLSPSSQMPVFGLVLGGADQLPGGGQVAALQACAMKPGHTSGMSADSHRERVAAAIRASSRPLDDDQLAARTGISPRQAVNQVCRALERAGTVRRRPGPDGKIVNEWVGTGTPEAPRAGEHARSRDGAAPAGPVVTANAGRACGTFRRAARRGTGDARPPRRATGL